MKKEGTSLEVQFQLREPVTVEPGSPPSTNGRLPQLTRVLTLAIHFEAMIQRGDARDFADVARQSCLCRERVSQIMRLLYLAPDIQMELLYFPPIPSGRFPISETAVRRVANLLSWADQRREWTRLKQLHGLA
jgi:hypothetical protein